MIGHFILSLAVYDKVYEEEVKRKLFKNWDMTVKASDNNSLILRLDPNP